VCRNHNPILSSFMTYNLICNKNNTMDTNMWSRNCLSFGSLNSSLFLCGLCFCVMFCRSLYVCPFRLFRFAMVLSHLRFTVSDCLFGIFKFLFDSCSSISHVCYHITYISTGVRLCVMYVKQSHGTSISFLYHLQKNKANTIYCYLFRLNMYKLRTIESVTYDRSGIFFHQ